MRPLVFHRQIIIDSLAIESPQIHLVHAAATARGISPPSAKTPQASAGTKATGIPSSRWRHRHQEWSRKIESASPGAPLIVDKIDLAMQNFAMAKQFPFTLSAVLPGQATIGMTGTAGPINLNDPAKTKFDLKLTGDNLPIDQLQSLLPAIGINLPNASLLQGGTLATHLTIVGPLQNMVVNGAVEFDNIRLSGFNLSSK